MKTKILKGLFYFFCGLETLVVLSALFLTFFYCSYITFFQFAGCALMRRFYLIVLGFVGIILVIPIAILHSPNKTLKLDAKIDVVIKDET